MSNGLHSQNLLEKELNGLLILANALGVSRPGILEVRDFTDFQVIQNINGFTSRSNEKLTADLNIPFNSKGN